MPTITQYRPAYFTGFDNATVSFDSVEDLLQIPWVDAFRFIVDNIPNTQFHQFSISEYGDRLVLMAEYNAGKEWWVVGYIEPTEIVKTMPVWTAK